MMWDSETLRECDELRVVAVQSAEQQAILCLQALNHFALGMSLQVDGIGSADGAADRPRVYAVACCTVCWRS